MDYTRFHTYSGSSCLEEVFWDPLGISVLNMMGFSPALPKSANLLIGSFDIERAMGDTLLREFYLHISTLEGCSPREGAFAILSTVIPSLAITTSSKLYICKPQSPPPFNCVLVRVKDHEIHSTCNSHLQAWEGLEEVVCITPLLFYYFKEALQTLENLTMLLIKELTVTLPHPSLMPLLVPTWRIRSMAT